MAAGDIRVADPLNAVRHEMDRVACGHLLWIHKRFSVYLISGIYFYYNVVSLGH